jgi:hypothetical protein
MLTKPDGYYCSHASRENDEPILGTAPLVSNWFLLEHHRAFGYEAVAESDIPAEVQTHLNEQAAAISGAKIKLIKQSRLKSDTLRFYAALSNRDAPVLLKFELDSYEQLRELDLTDIATQPENYETHHAAEKLYLVCTNGRRDPCCSQYGFPVYETIRDTFNGQVWESSHLGGHRYAPNIVFLPHGVVYGRANPETAPLLAEKYSWGELDIEHLRGRSTFAAHEQAAEGLLRAETDLVMLDDFSLDASQQTAENRWQVDFRNKQGQTHRVNLARHSLGVTIFASCKGDKQEELFKFELEEYKAL